MPNDSTIRWALKFGAQKINLHVFGAEFEPYATKPTPGSADLCFLSDVLLERWVGNPADHVVKIELAQ